MTGTDFAGVDLISFFYSKFESPGSLSSFLSSTERLSLDTMIA
jgi:hypothetical protein